MHWDETAKALVGKTLQEAIQFLEVECCFSVKNIFVESTGVDEPDYKEFFVLANSRGCGFKIAGDFVRRVEKGPELDDVYYETVEDGKIVSAHAVLNLQEIIDACGG